MRPKSYYRTMTFEKAECMRDLYFRKRMKQSQIAEMFGVGQNTVSRVISDYCWARPAQGVK